MPRDVPTQQELFSGSREYSAGVCGGVGRGVVGSRSPRNTVYGAATYSLSRQEDGLLSTQQDEERKLTGIKRSKDNNRGISGLLSK